MGAQTDKKIAAKPPTGHQPSSTAPLSSVGRGRRRLDFKRFHGKTLFLDLPGYRQVARLEQELTSRGATLETQFHSGVKYLITMSRNGDGKSSCNSPSTPSPNTPGTAKSSISQLLSPATDNSPSDATPVRQGILTRSQQMVEMCRGRGGRRRADLQSLAQQWGCKVVTLDEIQAELRRLKPLPPVNSTTDDRGSRIRALKGAFLKVEDVSRAYRPLVLEMKRWPRPLGHASHRASPFDPPQTRSQDHHHSKPPGTGGGRERVNVGTGGGRERVNGGGCGGRERVNGGGCGRERVNEVREKRPGHCECCSVRFEDLTMHLSSARHQEYARNEGNFMSLDRLIAGGKSFDQFISELRATSPNTTCNGVCVPTYTPPQSTSPSVTSSSSPPPDSVVLVTMPTSHATPTRRSPRKHPGSQHPSPLKTTPPTRKRKSNSPEATPTNTKPRPSNKTTPTNEKSPMFDATPTKRLRFSPDLAVRVKRCRSHTHSTTPTSRVSSQGSPVRKRARAAALSSSSTPSPGREGVRRSPRLLLKQLRRQQHQSPDHTS